MDTMEEIFKDNPTLLFFVTGMGIVFFVFCGFIVLQGFKLLSKGHEEGEGSAVPTSREGYKHLEAKVLDSWERVSRNNRLYLGALIIGLGVQKFGQITGHPIFGDPMGISSTYLIAFTSCFKHLINGKAFDRQVIACSLRGIQMEKEHPEWRVDFFRQFVKEYYQGYGMFSLALFRVLIPAWLLFSVIDFGILSRFEDNWPALKVALISIAIFMFAALFLWRVGGRHYYVLRTEGKGALG